MLISCQYVFAKPTKIACAKERALAWKSSNVERRNVRQGKFSAQKWMVLKRQQQQNFSPSTACWPCGSIHVLLRTFPLVRSCTLYSREVVKSYSCWPQRRLHLVGETWCISIHEVLKEQWPVNRSWCMLRGQTGKVWWDESCRGGSLVS